MRFNKIVVLVFAMFSLGFRAQELNCTVTVNHDRITNANTQIFKTLERSLSEFVNNTKFTSQVYKQNEKIECAMFINISEYNSGSFGASIQVQSSRPVYGSTFSTPIFNFNDRDFNFQYTEFEQLIYNPNSFDSNLIAVVAYYAHIIIGLDADTFTLNGGTKHFEAAQNLVNLASSSSYKGWKQADGNQNRFFLVQDLLSNTYTPFRKVLYQYHMNGLDTMADNVTKGKESVKSSLNSLSEVYKVRPNAFLLRVFFDSKSDEIVSIFSDGPKINIADLVENLNKFSPVNSSKWSRIKL